MRLLLILIAVVLLVGCCPRFTPSEDENIVSVVTFKQANFFGRYVAAQLGGKTNARHSSNKIILERTNVTKVNIGTPIMLYNPNVVAAVLEIDIINNKVRTEYGWTSFPVDVFLIEIIFDPETIQ